MLFFFRLEIHIFGGFDDPRSLSKKTTKDILGKLIETSDIIYHELLYPENISFRKKRKGTCLKHWRKSSPVVRIALIVYEA